MNTEARSNRHLDAATAVLRQADDNVVPELWSAAEVLVPGEVVIGDDCQVREIVSVETRGSHTRLQFEDAPIIYVPRGTLIRVALLAHR
jgi:hypothetical protein